MQMFLEHDGGVAHTFFRLCNQILGNSARELDLHRVQALFRSLSLLYDLGCALRNERNAAAQDGGSACQELVSRRKVGDEAGATKKIKSGRSIGPRESIRVR